MVCVNVIMAKNKKKNCQLLMEPSDEGNKKQVKIKLRKVLWSFRHTHVNE